MSRNKFRIVFDIVVSLYERSRKIAEHRGNRHKRRHKAVEPERNTERLCREEMNIEEVPEKVQEEYHDNSSDTAFKGLLLGKFRCNFVFSESHSGELGKHIGKER